MSRSAEQSVQTAASRRPSQTNAMDSGEVPGMVAASYLDAAKDVTDRGPQIDNTPDAIEQLRLETAIGMSDLKQETVKGMRDLDKAIRELRQATMDMLSATLPKSSNGSDDGNTSPSRNPGSWATAVTCLPEITSASSDTGIVGILGELDSNVVFPSNG